MILKPKILTALKGYTARAFGADALSGLIVGIVALPLAIAFAIASGVSPDRGLVTAVIAGFIISLLGGSRVQIGGPTGAFIVVVYSVVEKHGVDGLLVATILAGVILVLMGVARLGTVIKFIPYPVVVGFTSGIAVIIFSSQVKDLFGLEMGAVPAEFLEKWRSYAHAVSGANAETIGISAASLLVMGLWPRVSKRIPGPLVALLLSTIFVQLFHLDVETIGSRFHTLASSIPAPSFPVVSIQGISALLPAAITIAFLGSIESLLSAVVADGMIGGRHRSNMELVAQGVANLVTPLFGGIPATGAIARTATNIRNGGRTPVAGIVHALTLLLIMLAFGSLVSMVPLATLAAILVVVAYNMSEWRSFVSLMRSPRSDVIVLLTTFLLTVIVDLTVAIEVGLLLAVLLFMRRMVMVSNVGVVTREMEDTGTDDDPNSTDKRILPEGVEVFEINGPFFFGAAYKFREAMSIVERPPKVRILRMRDVPAIDSTAMHAIQEALRSVRHSGGHLLLADLHAQPLVAMQRSGLLDEIGEENAFGNLDDAVARSYEILGLEAPPPESRFAPTVAREKQPRS